MNLFQWIQDSKTLAFLSQTTSCNEKEIISPFDIKQNTDLIYNIFLPYKILFFQVPICPLITHKIPEKSPTPHLSSDTKLSYLSLHLFPIYRQPSQFVAQKTNAIVIYSKTLHPVLKAPGVHLFWWCYSSRNSYEGFGGVQKIIG